VIDLKENTSDN